MVHWIVQTNLLYDENLSNLKTDCTSNNCLFDPVYVIPFDHSVPVIIDSDLPRMWYGSTRMIQTAYNSRFRDDIFFDQHQFSVSQCHEYWKDYMLNSDVDILSLRDAVYKYGEKTTVFIRPVNDMKEFNGQVLTGKELGCWADRLQVDCDFNDMVQVCISSPKDIQREWRIFIVQGQAVTGSQYRVHNRLNISKDIPKDVLEFAEAMCKIYMPSNMFVVDIAEYNELLKIVEVNCIHSSGWYASDLNKLVSAINSLLICKGNKYDTKNCS